MTLDFIHHSSQKSHQRFKIGKAMLLTGARIFQRDAPSRAIRFITAQEKSSIAWRSAQDTRTGFHSQAILFFFD